MAEAFSNKLTRAAGIVTTSSSGSVGVTTTIITGISTVGVAVSDLVDNTNFIAGTKVTGYGDAASQVVVDQTSTNTSAVSGSAVVNFLGMTTAYTSAAATKSILIGGGTHGEVTLAYYNRKPIYLVNQLPIKDLSGWIMACATGIVNDFSSPKTLLYNKYHNVDNRA